MKGPDARDAPDCAVCGGNDFAHTPVIWSKLAEDWGLSETERRYIDIQQGTCCVSCGCNVRSIALARAVLSALGREEALASVVEGPFFRGLHVLEINAAGSISRYLARAEGHRLVEYPAFDMTALALPSAAYDLVVHSDTLEHVPNPLQALRECRRVLKPEGFLAFSVPIVVGRLTRSREGLTPSYHGIPGSEDESMRVYTEFGVDAWTVVLEAGFTRVNIVTFMFPSGIAMLAR